MIQHPTIPKGKHGKLLIKINEFLINSLVLICFPSPLDWPDLSGSKHGSHPKSIAPDLAFQALSLLPAAVSSLGGG